MTAPVADPEQIVADALRKKADRTPVDDARVALDALAAAGYALVQLPTEPAEVEHVTDRVTRVRVGRVTARVLSTGDLRNVTLESFLFTDVDDANDMAGEILAVTAWAQGWGDGTR
jgi:hypothetical protein